MDAYSEKEDPSLYKNKGFESLPIQPHSPESESKSNDPAPQRREPISEKFDEII